MQQLEECPSALNMREVYQQAIKELATPFPAIPLNEWPGFNRMVGGFRTREFTILCGSTGTGKTTFLANISAQLLKQRIKHFVMSVETGHTDYMKRIMSVMAGRDLNTGEAVSASDIANFTAQHTPTLSANCIEFSLHEDRVSVERLTAELLFMKEKRGCQIAFIDNLNFFMDVTSAANQVIETDRVIHSLIIFCKKVDMHLVMVMHPKKTDLEARVESEFDIKGSSTAVQEAHNVFLLNRPRQADIDSGLRKVTDRELTLKKMRRRGMYSGSRIIFENQNTRYLDRGWA